MINKRVLGVILCFVSIPILTINIYNKFNKSKYENRVNSITKISLEERQSQVDKIVEEGMMNVNYTPSITVKGNISEDFSIKNIENNNYPIKFKIKDENSNIVYESKLIDLGYELNGLEFTEELKPGRYEFRIFIGYSEEGNVESSFPLNVEVI